MSISARTFNEWLATTGLPDGASQLSKLLGMKRTTLHNQRIRGRVAVPTIIAAARAAQMNPLDVLGTFEPYAALGQERMPVTDAELLSQVSYVDALVHLLSRIRSDFAQALGVVPMEAIPIDDSVRNWLDAIDPGGIRQHISEHGGIAPSNLSAQLAENRLDPELSIIASHFAGVSSASGLVVSGLVTEQEAGWPIYGRVNVLSELGDVELIDLVADRLEFLRRHTKKQVDAEKAAANFLETLG
ncbi:hypothetical protein FQ154_18595 [Paeniglutamicibacter gangotriensis]|uniref:Uncharacterized protein n=1 Tax=Paeniglutamicibacter gangotriensis TaxID=254787 RepID=A0A5B0E5H5_9MICC|nr:hypothetical protein [Paeniglutamicibacter gangotriensis]KAA0973385.1 hypothetical protein FQ154_18595 [Paeniglutamicibacter gangotriensis]